MSWRNLIYRYEVVLHSGVLVQVNRRDFRRAEDGEKRLMHRRWFAHRPILHRLAPQP